MDGGTTSPWQGLASDQKIRFHFHFLNQCGMSPNSIAFKFSAFVKQGKRL
jgi:hypothetical protein